MEGSAALVQRHSFLELFRRGGEVPLHVVDGTDIIQRVREFWVAFHGLLKIHARLRVLPSFSWAMPSLL